MTKLDMQVWFSIWKSLSIIYHTDILKKENHTINSINTEKVFDKIQYLSMIKMLREIEIERIFLNSTKSICIYIYKKPYSWYYISWWKTVIFFLSLGTSKDVYFHYSHSM